MKQLLLFLCLWGFTAFSTQAQTKAVDASQAVFAQARQLYAAKQFGQVVSLLEDACAHQPENSSLWMLLGKAHEELGNNKEAQISFGKAAAALQHSLEGIEEEDAKRLALLRVLQTFAQLEVLPVETLDYIAELRRIDPKVSPKVRELEVRVYFQQNQFEKARQIAQKLLEMPNLERNKVDKQYLYFTILESSYRLDDFQTIGKYYQELEDESYKEQLAHIDPERYYQLGYAYFFMYDWTKSHEFLQRALHIEPNYVRARVFFNNLLTQEEDRRKAIEHSKTRIVQLEERAHDAQYYGDLTRLYLLEEKYSAAARAADSCLSIDPQKLEVHYLKGVAYYKNQENDEAIATFEELVAKLTQEQPQEWKAQFYFALGMAYKRAEPEKAPEAFEKARQGLYAEAAKLELSELNAFSYQHR